MCTKRMVIALLVVGCLGVLPATAAAHPWWYFNFRVVPYGTPVVPVYTPPLPLPSPMPVWRLGVNANPALGGGFHVNWVAAFSPALKAGIAPGEVIESVNGQRLWNDFDYERLLTRSPNPVVKLTVRNVYGGLRPVWVDLRNW